MIALALSLALLPSILLASPTFVKIQDILGVQTNAKSTLANATVRVKNELPIDAAIKLTHWRGGKTATEQNFEWDFTNPNDTTEDVQVTWETSESCRGAHGRRINVLTS